MQTLHVTIATLVCVLVPFHAHAQTTVPEAASKRTSPRITRQVAPEFSEEARVAGVSGAVEIWVVVAADGSISKLKIARGIGFGLDEMAEKAVRQWRYEPASKDGVSIMAATTVEVNFRLGQGRADFHPASLIFPNSPESTRPVLIEIPDKLADTGQENDPVVLDLEVGIDGHCAVVAMVSGDQADVHAVSKNVSTWRFKPAESSGSPVVMRGRLTYLMGKPEPHRVTQHQDGWDDTGTFRVSRNVSAPRMIRKFDPAYSDEARKAGVSGTVVTRIVVETDGSVKNIRIVHGIGFGLDEMAEESLRKWQFQPGVKDGVPVRVVANVEVNFKLLEKRPDFGPNALIFSLDPGVSRPELLKQPARVSDKGPDADPVVLDLQVDTEGKSHVLAVVRGDPENAEAVSKTVEKWRFEPAASNGKTVVVHGRLRYLLGKPDKQALEIEESPAPPH